MSTQTEEKKSVGLDWILFLVSTVVMLYMLFISSPWFWVALPFSLTYLVKGLRVI